MSEYIECRDCGCISKPTSSLMSLAICIAWCGNTPEYGWQGWPPEATSVFVDLARARQTDDVRIRCVLLVTALEALLEDLLITILAWSHVPVPIAELLLESFRGFERRGSLFRELTGQSIPKTFALIGLRNFYEGWVIIVKARNAFVHARLTESSSGSLLVDTTSALPSEDVLNAVSAALLDA